MFSKKKKVITISVPHTHTYYWSDIPKTNRRRYSYSQVVENDAIIRVQISFTVSQLNFLHFQPLQSIPTPCKGTMAMILTD